MRYNPRDKLISVTNAIPVSKNFFQGTHTFYLQPEKSSDQIYLFVIKRYSPSIEQYTREGVRLSNGIYSITLDELYRKKHRCHHNPILDKLHRHIVASLDYVTKHELDTPSAIHVPKAYKRRKSTRCGDDDRVE